MIKNQTNAKFYLYDCIQNKFEFVCEDWQELLMYIASYNSYAWWKPSEKHNSILDDYNCTLKDKNYDCSIGFFPKRYVVFDHTMRIIDVRLYQKKILSIPVDAYHRYKFENKPAVKWWQNALPEFRKGPVPHTGQHWRQYYRSPKTFNEIRQNSNPEHKEYVRKKRKYIPTTLDDKMRGFSRSWKDQSKKRKQWM